MSDNHSSGNPGFDSDRLASIGQGNSETIPASSDESVMVPVAYRTSGELLTSLNSVSRNCMGDYAEKARNESHDMARDQVIISGSAQEQMQPHQKREQNGGAELKADRESQKHPALAVRKQAPVDFIGPSQLSVTQEEATSILRARPRMSVGDQSSSAGMAHGNFAYIASEVDASAANEDQGNNHEPGKKVGVGDGVAVAQNVATPPARAHHAAADAADKHAAAAKRRRKRANQLKPGQTAGRWTPDEHQSFLEGLKIYGREWKKVADRIPTRTSAQIRSHAQKYFAKMARDEAIMLEQSPGTSGVPSIGQASNGASIGGTGSTQEFAPSLPPSVQENVERILANPDNVQNEVEDTLNQLRERYRQLQIRLQETHGQRSRPNVDGFIARNGAPDDHRVDNFRAPSDRSTGIDRRKRSLEDGLQHRQQEQQDHQRRHDDAGSACSSMSTSKGSGSIASSRELGDEELIALHVLGGDLPRSNSNQSLNNEDQLLQQEPLNELEGDGVPTGASPSSSIMTGEGDDSSGSFKRRRFSDDADAL